MVEINHANSNIYKKGPNGLLIIRELDLYAISKLSESNSHFQFIGI